MNERQRRTMGAPSVETPACAFCGRRAQSRHHVVPRSQGGEGGPTVTVCGAGNESGCHGLLHSHRLHLDWRGGRWVWLATDEPTKEDAALAMDGWRELKTWRGGREGANGEGCGFACSLCGFMCDVPAPNFCPNCGAKMVG
ncbi:hypothetical protein GMI70_02925 [Eggerthellaceae bacterium zg-893]|nr:hypothetical protein [Eggerthellaceae bacterium zg-893]